MATRHPRSGWILMALLLAGPGSLLAQDVVSSDGPAVLLDESLRHEVEAAVDRSLDWLAAQQKDDGSWSDPKFPALTGLALWAFANAPEHPKRDEAVRKAAAFIRRCVQDDGGIYQPIPGRKGGGLSNYNTAICMTALHAVGDPALTPIVLKARTFVARGQHFGDDIYDGGMGYDRSTGRAYADLLNSVWAFEAMRLTEKAEDLRPAGEEKADLNWAKAREFLARIQNEKEAGPEDAGGFPYRPDQSKAGAVTNDAGVVVFRSYGSMTYAGLLAMIYADVKPDDPRLKSAFDWSVKHWSLEENPGMGPQGLFFFYNVLTRALTAYGRDRFEVDGKTLDWRREVARKVVSLQKIEPRTGGGYWVNESSRFWEANPVLVTAYSTLALQIILGLGG